MGSDIISKVLFKGNISVKVFIVLEVTAAKGNTWIRDECNPEIR